MKDEIKEMINNKEKKMTKETIEIPLVKATYEELQEVICELQVERIVKDKEIERLNNIINNIHDDLEKTLEMNNKFEDNYGNELLNIDIDHMKYLISMLELKEKE